MTRIRFPKRRDDGSFTVFATFAAADGEIPVALLRDYVAAWVRAHRLWTRIWRSNVITEEHMELAAEFSSDPRVEVGRHRHAVAIVFEGRPCAHRWKDWVVFLVSDVGRMFHEVKFERFES